MGSADLMTRNFDHRVEVVFPIDNHGQIRYLRHDLLEMYLHDNTRARVMKPDATYDRLHPPSEDTTTDIQDWLMKRAQARKIWNNPSSTAPLR